MSTQRFYLEANELEILVGQTVFVAPLCFGPTGVWIEGKNQKQVDRSKHFVEEYRKLQARKDHEFLVEREV